MMRFFCNTLNVILVFVFLYKTATSQLYHQDDYTAKLERVQLIDYNRSLIKNMKLGLVWYNRTCRVIDAVIDLLVTITNDLKADVQVYKLLSNEYRFFPLTLHLNICAEMDRNFCGIADMLINSSNLTLCPIKPGLYHIHNAMFDFSKFPPHMPSGNYKTTIKYYKKSDFVVEFHIYGVVQTVLKKWEN